MALLELGKKITASLQSLDSVTSIEECILNSMLKNICVALIEADVNIKLIKNFREDARSVILDMLEFDFVHNEININKMIQVEVFKQLVRLIDPGTKAYHPQKGHPNVILVVGHEGCGKSLTCLKLAHYYKKKKWKACIVYTDTAHVKSYHQMKQISMKSKIALYNSQVDLDPVVVAIEGVKKFKEEGYDLILVDTFGRHKTQESFYEETLKLKIALDPDNIFYVMDSIDGQACKIQAKTFKDCFDLCTIIVTKLDNHTRVAGALTSIAAACVPIIFVGTGDRLNDLALYRPRYFISKLLDIKDMKDLLKKVKNMNASKNAQQNRELIKNSKHYKIKCGSLQDMCQQMAQIIGSKTLLDMGGVSSLQSLVAQSQPNIGDLLYVDGNSFLFV